MPAPFRGRQRGSFRRRGRGNGKKSAEHGTPEVDDNSLEVDGETADEEEENRVNKRVRWDGMDEGEDDSVKDEDASGSQSHEDGVTQVVDIKVNFSSPFVLSCTLTRLSRLCLPSTRNSSCPDPPRFDLALSLLLLGSYRVGCAYYDPTTGIMSVLEDTSESSHYDMSKLSTSGVCIALAVRYNTTSHRASQS